MSLKRTELTGSFTAIDPHGQPRTILAFRDVSDAGPDAGPLAKRSGRRSFQVETGRGLDDVSRVGKGLYRMPSGGLLRTNDPDAL